MNINLDNSGCITVSLDCFQLAFPLAEMIEGEHRISREDVCLAAKRDGITINEGDIYEIMDSLIIDRNVYLSMKVIRGDNAR